MSFCGKCGAPINGDYKFCKKCGAPLKKTPTTVPNNNLDKNTKLLPNITKSDDVISNDNLISNSSVHIRSNDTDTLNQDRHGDNSSVNHNYTNRNDNKNFLKPIIISICAFTIVAISFFFSKDYIFYAFFNCKGNLSGDNSSKIISYSKAYQFNSNNKIIDSLSSVLASSESLDEDLESIKSYFNENDFKTLCKRVYTSKAESSFESDDLNSCREFLDEASSYGYPIRNFKYYYNLQTASDSNDSTEKKVDDKKLDENKSKDSTTNVSYNRDYLIYDSDSRLLSENELSVYSKYDLALIRNEIFAKHGYIFQTEPFKSYFNSRKWYNPNPNFKGTSEELNNIERTNVELLQRLEK